MDFDSGYRFVLGTANVAGLSNKVAVLESLPAGIWSLTETHLTAAGMDPIRIAIKQMGRAVGRSLRTLFGAPAPSRTVDSQAGSWTGVCTVSDFPCATVPVQWPDGVFTSGRALVTSHFVGGTHLVVGTVYGAAQSPSFRDPLAITQTLLRSVADEIVHNCRGPRCIMGDFNCNLMQFPEMEQWRNLGWQEVQIFAQQVHLKPVEPTCKGVTIRDFVWCSPELLQFFQSAVVFPSVFPDHAVIGGVFHFPDQRPCTWTWPTPKPIPWHQVRKADWHQTLDSHWTPFDWPSDTTKDFANWSHQFEQSLQTFVTTPHGRLPPGCGGRGQTMQRHKRLLTQPTVKASRPGEEALQCAFPSRQLLQQYRQLRRLQSLLHGCRNGISSPAAWSYQSLCWSAIIRAPGFRPSFRHWWNCRPIRLQSSPLHLDGLPPLDVLECVFLDFRLNFRNLEAWHNKQRSKLAQVRRETSMKDLFRSMKPKGPEPLDFLQNTKQYTISAVAPATGAVLLDAVPDFHQGVWDFAGERVFPSLAETAVVELDRAWCLFESDRLPLPGMSLTHHIPIVQVPDIHRSLLDFWAQRWQALSTVPADAWARILSFVRAFVPRHSLPCPALTPADVRAMFRSGSGLRTGGPDGWRKEDVISLPDSLLTDAVNLFAHIENGGTWPTQLVRGHVTCLQKKPCSFDIANFRPIVVFSLWYRLWGCLRARHYLAQLEQIADFPAFGFLAGRGCKDVTFVVQAAVEVALKSGTPCCGALFDIEKCFNCLPREPIMFLAEWFGLDTGVIHAWKSFLQLMHRAFIVHDMPSEAILSDHGLPEGDSMSCVGMVLLNFSYHFYLHHFQPQLVEISDNLEVLGFSPGQLIAGTATLQTWADLFRLTIDVQKSSCWAVTAQDRQALHALGLPVVMAGADLGASMIYGAAHRNKVLQDRVQAVKPFWLKLRHLKVSVWHKLLLIRMALLPRALHASNLTFLGSQWFTGLRTQIMRAMRADRAGANPLIRVSFIFGLDVDPGFYDAWHTFHDLVFYVQRNSYVCQQWDLFCQSSSVKRTHGPFDKFVRLLSQLGWTLVNSDQISLGSGLCFSLRNTDLAVWKMMLIWFWRQQVAVQVSARKDYGDLDGINYEASFSVWRGLDKAKSELLNCIKDGTFHNGASKSKFDSTQFATCSCGLGPDDTAHRAMVCPYYAQVRSQFLDMVQMWSALPVCMTIHGLCPRNPMQLQYWKCLGDIPWDPLPWQHSPPHDGVQHLFTDGSCAEASNPACALASWSVISADLECPVGAGLLPGCLHNSHRSEIWAMVMAIQWLVDFQRSGHLYTDSQSAAEGLEFLLQHLAVPSDWSDRDLWDHLLQRLLMHEGTLQVTKVKAHQTLDSGTQSAFQTRWNAVADTSAKAARASGGTSELVAIRSRLFSIHAWQLHWTRRSQDFLLAMAVHGVQMKDEHERHSISHDPEDELVCCLSDAALNHCDWQDTFPLNFSSAILSCPALVSFGAQVAISFCHWLLDIDRRASHVKSVTVIEFYMGYHLCGGLELPIAGLDQRAQKIWIPMEQSAVSELVPRTLKTKLDVFVALVDLVFSKFEIFVDKLLINKPFLGITRTVPAMRIPWPTDVEQRVCHAISFYTARKPIIHARDLARPWP